LSPRKLSFRASDGSVDIESGLRGLGKNISAGVKHIASTAQKPGKALNRKIDVVGDFAVERAVGAAAGALGKKFVAPYLDLFFEDLDMSTVTVSDTGLRIDGPSRLRRRAVVALGGGSSYWANVELGPLEIVVPLDDIATRSGDTPPRVTLSTVSVEWLPFPDLMTANECFEVLSELNDSDAAGVALDMVDANSPAGRRKLERARRAERDSIVAAELEAERPVYAAALRRLEGRCFLAALIVLIVLSILASEVAGSAGSAETLRLIVSVVFVAEILVRLRCYSVLRPRGARQFFESALNNIDVTATALDVAIWLIIGAGDASGVANGARGARLVRFLRVSRGIVRVGRVASSSVRVGRALMRRGLVSNLRFLDGVELTAARITIVGPAAAEADVDDWFEAGPEKRDFISSSVSRSSHVFEEGIHTSREPEER